MMTTNPPGGARPLEQVIADITAAGPEHCFACGYRLRPRDPSPYCGACARPPRPYDDEPPATRRD